MAGFDPQLISGGAQPTLTSAPTARSGGGTSPLSLNVQPHHGLIGLVLAAVVVLFLLDRAGFRFAVTAGKR